MDFSKFTTNDWLIVGGGIGMLIFGTFVDWLSAGPFSAGNAFDFFFTGTVPWILVVGAAVITVLLVMDKIGGSTPWPLILVLATVLAAILLLIRLLFNPGASGVDRGTGMYLSVLSGLVAAAGAVMNYTASGGDLKDLTDPNKLKAAFSSGSGGSTSSSTQPSTTTDDMPPPPPPPPSKS